MAIAKFIILNTIQLNVKNIEEETKASLWFNPSRQRDTKTTSFLPPSCFLGTGRESGKINQEKPPKKEHCGLGNKTSSIKILVVIIVIKREGERDKAQ